MSNVPIKHSDQSQETEAIQKIAGGISEVLSPNEEILYIAMQNKMAISPKKDGVAVTSNRIIFYRPAILGRFNFADYQWQDISKVHIKQGMMSTDFVVETVKGATDTVPTLDKEQARRAYSIAQQYELEWREKRRVRQMEEDRAKAGGVFVGTQSPTAAVQGATPAPQVAEDPVEKLAKAKKMVEAGLISEAEYEAVKAKILAAM